MHGRLLLPLLLVAAAGCTSVKTSLREPLPPLMETKGVIVFSTGAPEASYVNVIGLQLTAVDRNGGTSNLQTDVLMNRGYDSSDFKDEHGQVRMAALDEGNYCFYAHVLNPYLKFKGEPPTMAFRVKKGAVTYIGSLFMNGLEFSVRNKEARDWEKAVAAHPELANMPKVVSPARIVRECAVPRGARNARGFDDF